MSTAWFDYLLCVHKVDSSLIQTNNCHQLSADVASL